MAIDGAERLEIDTRGDLIVHAGGQRMRHQRPVAYQSVDGRRHPVPVTYVVSEGNRVSFSVPDYRRNVALVIDPIIDLGGGISGVGQYSASAGNGSSDLAGLFFRS